MGISIPREEQVKRQSAKGKRQSRKLEPRASQKAKRKRQMAKPQARAKNKSKGKTQIAKGKSTAPKTPFLDNCGCCSGFAICLLHFAF
jgi:regulator of protease activity HflC (stomatin/prohibitin superfamily)